MKIVHWCLCRLVRHMALQAVIETTYALWPEIQNKIPAEQRISFIATQTEKHAVLFLEDMTQKERASLMNALLPTIIREFPLADLEL